MNDLRNYIKELGAYVAYRFRQIFFFSYAGINVFVGLFTGIKSWIVSKMFWGRGSFYRTSFQLIITVLSIAILVSGISSKLNIFGASASGLGLSDTSLSQDDVFSQSGTSQALVLNEGDQYDYMVYKHQVQPGDTLLSISGYYNINIKTLMWANSITNSNASLQVGKVLKIPEIDGVFYTVKKDDTLEKIAKTVKSDTQTILDYNTKVLDFENPVLTEGMELFIPGGQVIVPTKPPVIYVNPGGGNPGGNPVQLPIGTYINPLSNCPGYVYIRGFSGGHKGVDLSKGGGCWINAAGPGVVVVAGWGSRGEGWHVTIDHGNGIRTWYFHGSGRFAVKTGDHVLAGQNIMYMGSSGNSTGTHLHFAFLINGVHVNPEQYVKVR